MTWDEEETRVEELRRKAAKYRAEKEEDEADDWGDKWDQKNREKLTEERKITASQTSEAEAFLPLFYHVYLFFQL